MQNCVAMQVVYENRISASEALVLDYQWSGCLSGSFGRVHTTYSSKLSAWVHLLNVIPPLSPCQSTLTLSKKVSEYLTSDHYLMLCFVYNALVLCDLWLQIDPRATWTSLCACV